MELISDAILIPPQALLYSLPLMLGTCAGPALLSSPLQHSNFQFDNTHFVIFFHCLLHTPFTARPPAAIVTRLTLTYSETTTSNVPFKARSGSTTECVVLCTNASGWLASSET
eukprot:2835300-Ditylum_brightwellii.AAC.1